MDDVGLTAGRNYSQPPTIINPRRDATAADRLEFSTLCLSRAQDCEVVGKSSIRSRFHPFSYCNARGAAHLGTTETFCPPGSLSLKSYRARAFAWATKSS